MHLRVRLKRGDSSSVSTEVGPVIYLLHTLFTQIDVVIQNKNVTSSTGHYPYKAMIQMHLKYERTRKTLSSLRRCGSTTDLHFSMMQNVSLAGTQAYPKEVCTLHMEKLLICKASYFICCFR